MKQNSFFIKYKSVVWFFLIEILALFSFTFANINELFFIIAALLAITAFLFSFFTNVDRSEYKKFLPVVIFLFVVSGIAAFGGFSTSFSSFSNIAVFFAIPSFFSLGFFARRLWDGKFENVFLAIGFGFAALTLISTFATWIQYGPFYALIYKSKPIYFENGAAYNVTKEMNWLMGFSITEVSLEYGGLFALIAASFLPALLFIKIKENKKLFICSAVIGGIGLISIISIPNFRALIILAFIVIFLLIYKFFSNKKKLIKSLSIALYILIGIGVVVYLLTIFNAMLGFKFSGVLEKVFCTNYIMKGPSEVLKAAFSRDVNGSLYNLFGFNLANPSSPAISLLTTVKNPTLIFEYEIIKELGIIGALLLVIFLIYMFINTVHYLKKSDDNSYIKIVVISILLAIFIYSTYGFTNMPEAHSSNIYQAFTRSVPFMISLFLLGFIYLIPNKKVNETNEEVKEKNL